MEKAERAEQAHRRIEFKLDNNLIHHLVDRQSATPEKALLELVMNSADAGATRVDLSVSANGFEIVDNGAGFASEAEIHRFFATFGTPQEGEKTYGRYRVGRAQIFGWATTTWESNDFQMTVDLATDNQGFGLRRLDPPFRGCRIRGTWNDRGTAQGGIDAYNLVRQVRQALLFPPVEIWIAGELAAKPAEHQEWTSQTDEAFFRLGTYGPVRLFNQGVFVCEIPHTDFHVGGVVLTKTAIELTMARNEPLQYSPGWQKISQHLREQANALHADGGSIGTEEFRAYALRRALTQGGDLDVACVTQIPKKHISVRAFLSAVKRSRSVAFASRGELVKMETALQGRRLRAASLHFDTLERLRPILGVAYTTEDIDVVLAFLTALEPVADAAGIPLAKTAVYWPACLPESDLFGERLDWDHLTHEERTFLNEASGGLDELASTLGVDGRSLAIAENSGEARAYTDGRALVTYNRRFVEEVLSNRRGAAFDFVLTFVHELCHGEDSRNAGHDDVFYSEFHRYTVTHAPAVAAAVASVERAARQARFPAQLSSKELTPIRETWFEPGERFMPDAVRLEHVRKIVAAEIERLKSGETTVDEAADRLKTLTTHFHEYGSDGEFGPRLDQVAERLRFCGPVLWVMQHAPFEKPPAPEMLTAFCDGAWDELEFCSPWLGTGTRDAKVNWKEHPAGDVEVRQTRFRWKPHKKMPADFPIFFQALARRFAEAFPWADRNLERDLVWAMMARLTLRLWRQGEMRWGEARGASAVRARRLEDPPASYFNITTRANVAGWKRDPLGDEWKSALIEAYPGLIICTGEQLVQEGIAAFTQDALGVQSKLDETRFWLKWAEAK